MFYVLNFENHKFTSCDYESQAAELIGKLLSEGISKDSLEIVNGFNDDDRMSVDQFRQFCLEQGTGVDDSVFEVTSKMHSNRLAGIQAYKQNTQTLQQAAEDEKQRKTNDLMAQIRALKPRIDELIATGKACLENGIEINAYDRSFYRDLDSYEKGTFFTNSISHHVGFVDHRGIKDITLLGINNGGACGSYDFRTDGEQIYSVHEKNPQDYKEPSIHDMEYFLRNFDKFESSFYAYVDKAIEKQQRSVDQLIAKAQAQAGKPSSTRSNPDLNR